MKKRDGEFEECKCVSSEKPVGQSTGRNSFPYHEQGFEVT